VTIHRNLVDYIVYNFPQATLPKGQQIGTLAYMKLKRKLSILWSLSYLKLKFFLSNYDVSWLTIAMLGGLGFRTKMGENHFFKFVISSKSRF